VRVEKTLSCALVEGGFMGRNAGKGGKPPVAVGEPHFRGKKLDFVRRLHMSWLEEERVD